MSHWFHRNKLKSTIDQKFDGKGKSLFIKNGGRPGLGQERGRQFSRILGRFSKIVGTSQDEDVGVLRRPGRD